MRMKTSVWWPGISKHVSAFIQNCPVCAWDREPRKEPLITTTLPDYPWQMVGSDLVRFLGSSLAWQCPSKHFWFLLDFSSSFLNWGRYGQVGVRCGDTWGSFVRRRRPIRSHQGKGVLLKLSSARQWSSDCWSSCLTVFTTRSIRPLLCGNLGLLVLWVNLYWLAKLANSAESNWGPLSLLTVSGIPNLAKAVFRAEMTAAEVVVESLVSSEYREK